MRRIRVPLDWDRPNGRTISLALIRHLASKPDERIGTLFINPGGPGDTGVGLVQRRPRRIDAFGGGRFDVVSWDPRGTNASTRVRCFRSQRSEARFWAGASIPATKAASEPSRARPPLGRRCGEVSGWLLPHISTADTARDLDHLRVLMGEEKLTYVGLSYGTLLGQTYANLFPDRIRAMLLDGIVERPRTRRARRRGPAGVSSPTRSSTSSSRSATAPDRSAARSPVAATPRPSASSGCSRVKRAPIPAPGARPPLSSRQELSYGDTLLSQFQPLRAPRTWPANAADLDAALRGDGSTLESGASGFSARRLGRHADLGGGLLRRRARPPGTTGWPSVIKRFERAGRLSGRVQGWWRWAPCAAWPVRGEDNYRGPWTATTPNPILLINSTFDPNTGYAKAVHVEQLLGNAVLLTQEGYGHLSFQNPSACVDQAMVDYLTELITPPPGTVCQSDQQPFDPDFR